MGGATTSSTKNSQTELIKTICVFGLRGGVGKTTLAVNLALALAQMGRGEVGFLDLALDTLHASLLLDLRPKNYLTNLVDWPDTSITRGEVDELLCRHPAGVALLEAAENPQEAELLTSAMLEMAWPHLADKFATLVVDAGSHFDDLTLSALEHSDMILLVFSPELASLKSTTDALTVFAEIGIPQKKILTVANWVFPTNPLLLKRILPALKADFAAEIPYEPMSMGKALNTGHPLLTENPKTPAAEAIRALARTLSELHQLP
jgi:pilus assembly protein CpaE